MKRVLMIAFHYPPLRGSSGIQRTLAFSRDLREHGWEPIVLSANPRAYPETGADQLRDIPEGVDVHRPFALDASRHLSIRGAYPRWLALPDRWSSWRLGAVPEGLAIAGRSRPDVIWSTFPIATAHRIGMDLHRLTGRPWVADFRDSMTEVDYPSDPAVFRAYRSIERGTVENAARAVFTTPGARRMYAERYPDVPSDRWAVIPNGFDEGTFVDVERGITLPAAGRQPAVLVHSGLIYPSERDPRPFFSALGTLRREGRVSASSLQVILRGTGYDDQYGPLLRAEGIDDIVRLETAIGYRAALGEMMAADGLLLFQAANCNHQIPAKLYEYFRARRPIFALTDAAGDTAATLSESGAGTVVPLDSPKAIEQGLIRFLDEIRAGQARVPDRNAVDRYSRRSRARELASLFDSVIRG